MRTQVGIIGAGPAGLLLSRLLTLQGIDSVVLENRSRDYVEARIRAGILEQHTVDTLTAAGVGDRLRREGLEHSGVYLQYPGTRHKLDFPELCGRTVWVYGQTEVTKDLIATQLDGGPPLLFDVADVVPEDVDTDSPRVRFTDADGTPHVLECDVIAGTDGFHGPSRAVVAGGPGGAQVWERTYPYAWLGILADAAPATDELIYAWHPDGFALYSMRSPTVSRLYLQVDPSEKIEDWSDDRIWDGLATRFALEGWELNTGPVTDKSILPMRSFVSAPMRRGRLFLAGDAAHIVPPTGAKGLNLAVADVTLLATALTRLLQEKRTDLVDAYSDTALRRVWRCTHFSWWMTSMLHTSGDDFDAQLQLSQLRRVCSSETAARELAENYTGLPIDGVTTATPRGLVPVLVSTVAVVAVISSLGAPLVPAIAETHDVPVHTAQWALTVTFLVGAVATPVLGRLGDGPHRRDVMLAALAVVVAGSALAALPLGFGWLLAGRALQGMGLGLAPLAMATARDALSGTRQRGAIASLSITVVAGVGLGYPVAGLVADLGGLHAAFWFGAVVAALALVAGALVLPAPRSAPSRRIDVPGALLLGATLAAGLLVLSEGGTWGWTSPRVLGLAAVAVLGAAGWVAWALRTPTPLVDLRLARGRSAATAHLASLLVGLANYLLLSSATVFAQTPTDSGYGFGASVVTAGLVLVPFSLASVAASRTARVMADRFGPRVAVPAGALVLAAGLGLYALTPSSIWALGGVMAVAGFGTGAVFALLPALVVAAVPPRETGSAMSLNQVLRYVGFATGSATTAAVLDATTPAGSAFPAPSGYTALGLAGLAVGLLTALVTWLLPPRPPAAASRSRTPARS